MQNLIIENKFLIDENKKQIKKIWLNNFLDDDENTVDLFLENVFENEKGVGAFLNNELIAMILFLNSKIIFKDRKINSIYFYAVCTEQNYRNQGVMRSLFEFAKEKAKEQGAELLVTACPLCLYNLKKNTDGHELPVVYFTELLAQLKKKKKGDE